eukprot:360184-Chlamydomonas_euryale.AAC.3
MLLGCRSDERWHVLRLIGRVLWTTGGGVPSAAAAGGPPSVTTAGGWPRYAVPSRLPCASHAGQVWRGVISVTSVVSVSGRV